MDRKRTLREVANALGNRRLIWAGLRAEDVESLRDLPQLYGSFSIVGGRPILDEQLAFENLSGTRVDVDAWDIEYHAPDDLVQVFREAFLRALAGPSALLPYRPSRFLSGLQFARRDTCLNLGLFGDHQQVFDHKPWVETAIATLGLPTVPWAYLANEEFHLVDAVLKDGPLMVRRSRSSGGAGLALVESPEELDPLFASDSEALVSVAPYLEDVVPINVGATVWDDEVTISHPSVQLIGIPECTARPFGYCGNDFGAARDIEPVTLDAIEASTNTVGAWLRTFGYLGSFGVDYLLHNGVPLFSEINPRFQGSTHASAQLSVEAGEACLLLEHIAAFLHLSPMGMVRPLRRLATEMPAYAHFVVHNTSATSRRIDPHDLVTRMIDTPGFDRADVLTHRDLSTDPGGIVARFSVRDQLTTTGFDLTEPWAGHTEALVGEPTREGLVR